MYIYICLRVSNEVSISVFPYTVYTFYHRYCIVQKQQILYHHIDFRAYELLSQTSFLYIYIYVYIFSAKPRTYIYLFIPCLP